MNEPTPGDQTLPLEAARQPVTTDGPAGDPDPTQAESPPEGEPPAAPREGDQTVGVLPPTGGDPERTLLADGSAAAALAPVPPQDRVNVPGYEILGELGRGGMGVVYKARHLRLNRLVALKMILSGSHAGVTELRRFRNEAEAVARTQHPNLVQIYEIGEHEGRPFFALEFVDGRTLAAVMGGQPQPPRFAAQMVEQLARAAHAAHQAGIVHRDLKPGNVLLTAAGVPKITDFGLAKRLDGSGVQTATGDVLGTPVYMAPEQAAGRVREIGPQTDVYALGVILYEMLTGRPPFLSAVSVDIVRQVISDEPVSPSRLQRGLPRDLVTVCLKCLEKDPKKRYPSAEALADDLHHFLEGEPITARPASRVQRAIKWARRRPALAALLAVSVLATLALLLGGWVYNVRLQRALQEAQEQTEKSRRLLVRLNVASGARLLDEGNWFGALVWFTHALEREEGRPEREGMHRMRLASILQRAPELRQFWFHGRAVRAGRFSPDGRLVVTAAEDGKARVWDVASGAAVGPPLEHGPKIVYAELSADGRRLLTCGRVVTRLWSVETGKPLEPPLKHERQGGWARFSPDGQRVATPGDGKAAWLWDVGTGQRRPVVFAHGAPVEWAAFSADGRYLATAGKDGSARVWNARTGAAVTPPLKHAMELTHAVFSPEGARLLTASLDGTARLWAVPSGKPLTPPLRHTRAVRHGAFTADGKWVATCGDDRTARIWSAATGEPRTPPLRHSSDVNQVRFSPDGRWAVTAADDNTARLWDAHTGELLPPWLPHTGSVNGAAVSPDGRRVLTFSNDTTARLWDVAPVLACITGKGGYTLPPEPPTPGGKVEARSPDGRLLAKAEAGNVARLYDAQTGAQAGPPLEHGSFVVHVAFSPDGKALATASDDNTARLWDVTTGKLLAPPLRHHATVRHVAFSPDGRLVATASDDETARVWDEQTGEPLTAPLHHAGAVRRAEFSKDGGELVTTPFEGPRRRWPLARDDRPAHELTRLAEVLSANHLDGGRGLVPLEVERLRQLWETVGKVGGK
jgi:eukaryotic-like serine/threonine-protein kinase